MNGQPPLPEGAADPLLQGPKPRGRLPEARWLDPCGGAPPASSQPHGIRSGSDTGVPPRSRGGCGRGAGARPEGGPSPPVGADPTGTEAGVRLSPTSRQHNSKRHRQPAGPSPDGQTNKAPHPHAERRGKEARMYPATPTSHAGRSAGKARQQATRRDSTDGTRPEQASPQTPRAQWVGSDHYRVQSFFWGQVMGMFRNETEVVGAQHCECAKCRCIVEY